MRPVRLRRALALLPLAALVAALLPAGPAAATFPGDNGKIFWVSMTVSTGPNSPSVGDIYSANPDGTEVTNLTPDTEGSDENYPAVSPDGATLAFGSDRNSKNDLDPFLLDLATLEVTPLPSTEGSEGWFAWSPDGTKLAWSVDSSAIKVFDMSTGMVDEVASDGWHPNFSPSGSKIVFIKPVNEGPNDIFSVNVDGTGQTQLTNTADEYEFAPNYSPDGSKVIYSKADSSFEIVDLWTMNADGSSEAQLTDLGGWASEPTWSPDGTKIAFTRDSDGMGSASQDLVTASADGSNVQPLHASALIEDHPDWQALGNEGPGEEPVEVKPSLSLGLKKHIVAKVTVTSDGACKEGLPVKIQKSVSGKWKTIASGATVAGVFKKKIADKPGKYRAKSTAFTDGNTQCLGSKSAAKTHKH
jgi:hypothetical protein